MSRSEDDIAKSPLDGPHPHPDLGPWPTIYEPVFAYANIALQGFLHIKPDVRALDENLEVIDGKAFDIRICVYGLRKALEDVKYEPISTTRINALKGLLRDLFDDPALQVNVKEVREDGRLLTELEILGECHTAHGLPAPYIMGKDRLTPTNLQTRKGQGFVSYKHAVVGSKVSQSRL